MACSPHRTLSDFVWSLLSQPKTAVVPCHASSRSCAVQARHPLNTCILQLYSFDTNALEAEDTSPIFSPRDCQRKRTRGSCFPEHTFHIPRAPTRTDHGDSLSFRLSPYNHRQSWLRSLRHWPRSHPSIFGENRCVACAFSNIQVLARSTFPSTLGTTWTLFDKLYFEGMV